MKFHTRKIVKPEDLNANNTLFGGRLLKWIDEEAAIYAMIQLDNMKTVTKFMSEIDFISSAVRGDIVEIGIEAIRFGKTSLSLACEVRNKMTRKVILTINKIVLVSVNEDGNPIPHGKTKVEYIKDRMK